MTRSNTERVLLALLSTLIQSRGWKNQTREIPQRKLPREPFLQEWSRVSGGW